MREPCVGLEAVDQVRAEFGHDNVDSLLLRGALWGVWSPRIERAEELECILETIGDRCVCPWLGYDAFVVSDASERLYM